MSRHVLFSSPQEWALCAITAFWGASFLIVRIAMQESGPFGFVGLSFGIAALTVGLCSLTILRGITRRELMGGAILGALNFVGFSLQAWALITIPATKSAFLTAFYVPLVPLLELFLMRQRPGPCAWLGMTFAFLGVILLSGLDGLSGGIGQGELLTLLCAVAFAFEIVVRGMIAPDTNPRRIATVELAVTSLLAFACMPVLGEAIPPFSWTVVCAGVGLGAATALIQTVIVWAQKSIPPTRATIIYTGEPVWAGIVGYAWGERLPLMAFLGCALVIVGILVSGKPPQKEGGSGKGRPLRRQRQGLSRRP